MDTIQQQIRRASRRLLVSNLLDAGTWILSAAFIVALIGLAIPKIWALDVTQTEQAARIWTWSWIGGSFALALIVLSVVTWMRRRSAHQAAVEIDSRFGLKERLSSVVALNEEERQTNAGAALMDDAQRKAATIDVRDEFGWGWSWPNLLPVATLLVVFMLAVFVDYAEREVAAVEKEAIEAQRERIRTSRKELRKTVAEQLKHAKENDLKEAEVALKQVEQMLDDDREMTEQSKREALVKLNDIKQQLEERANQIGDPDQLKRQLGQMKDIKQGPADQVANAMRRGEFGKAAEKVRDLVNQMSRDDLTAAEKQELAQQLSDLQQSLNDAIQKQEQAKQQLQNQIDKAKEEGDEGKARQLQQQLDQMNQSQRQMDQLQDLADKLGQAGQSMQQAQNGQQSSAEAQQQMQQAQQALNEFANQMQQMQMESDSLETLDQVMQQVGECKNMLNGGDMQSMGDFASMGQDGSGGNPEQRGQGNSGEGRGEGERAESETDTNFYESRVRGTPRQGEAVVTGTAGGANINGMTRSQAVEQVQSSLSSENDPFAEQRLPRNQRDHARDYFRKYTEEK